MWRRSLNPARFDRWHPIEGPIIGGINPQPQTLPPPTNPPPTNPPVNPPTNPPTNPPDNPPLPPGVPEPGSMAVALGLIGAGWLWRRRSQRLPAA